jgi:nucleotide-binding universal stress UspA family protein
LAIREEAELHVVHSWAFAGETILRAPSRTGREILNQLLEAEEDQRRIRLEALVDAEVDPAARANVHLVRAEAAEGVGSVARSVHADVVVMGTLSRAGVGGLLIGNTAETVLNRLDCSVLTVKPEGFETPVSI